MRTFVSALLREKNTANHLSKKEKSAILIEENRNELF